MRLALLPLLLLAPALAPAFTAAAPTRDWRGVAAMKPDGAYVVGNPAAKVRRLGSKRRSPTPNCWAKTSTRLPTRWPGTTSGASSDDPSGLVRRAVAALVR